MTAVAESHERRLLEGSAAIAQACVAAGCRFFAGYPMTPFTELLENMAALLPTVGGVCVNAESELEAVGMAWGAAATGARAATGSTGQGLSLMQESLAEMAFAQLPIVIFNMARGQSDYFQATRGCGHGDARHLVLAPCDLTEAVALTQEAFHLADVWRNPVLVFGDYLLAHTWEAVEIAPIDFGPTPAKDWAVDGSRSGTGASRAVTSLGIVKSRDADAGSAGIPAHYEWAAERANELAASPARAESELVDDADVVVVAFGSPARFVRAAVHALRADGHRVGYVRPITLFPFPSEAVATAARRARCVAVFELNGGQMIDDVRLAVMGAASVVSIGGVSTDRSGFGVGPMLDVEVVKARITHCRDGDE